MWHRTGQILLALTLIGLGVMNTSYPSSILLKTMKFYSTLVPVLAELHLNVVLGLLMFLTSVALLMRQKHAACLVQVVAVCNIALQCVPKVPGLDNSEQFVAMASLAKCVGLFGASLLLSN